MVEAKKEKDQKDSKKVSSEITKQITDAGGCIEKKALEGLTKTKGDYVKAVENALKEVFMDREKACSSPEKPGGKPKDDSPAAEPAAADESPDKEKPKKKPLCPGIKKEC